jgi:hypothetical protein
VVDLVQQVGKLINQNERLKELLESARGMSDLRGAELLKLKHENTLLKLKIARLENEKEKVTNSP